MKIINTFKDKKITLLVVFLILFLNITAYSQNTNDSGTTNTASTTLVEKEQTNDRQDTDIDKDSLYIHNKYLVIKDLKKHITLLGKDKGFILITFDVADKENRIVNTIHVVNGYKKSVEEQFINFIKTLDNSKRINCGRHKLYVTYNNGEITGAGISQTDYYTVEQESAPTKKEKETQNKIGETVDEKEKTATNEQEDEEDWVVENDGNWFWFLIIAGFISVAITCFIYNWCRKKDIIDEIDWDDINLLSWRWDTTPSSSTFVLLSLLFGIIFGAVIVICTCGIITKKKYISSIVVGKSIGERRAYIVQTDYKGVIFTHYFSKKNYDNINIKDTFCFEVRNGLWNTNISSTENARIKHHQEGSKIIRKDKQYTINNKILVEDLNSLVNLEDSSEGYICIEFCLSNPLMYTYNITILSRNKQKANDEFIKFINNLKNCGKVAESGRYVLYAEFDKGIIVKADLTKIGLRDLKVRNIKSEIKLYIPDDKQYIHNQKLLIDDLNSQVSLADNSKGHFYIEFSLSGPSMFANDIKVLSGNKKAKNEFIKFINNLNNCGKIAKSGKYVLYCEFDKGKIHRADLRKTD